MDHSAAGSLEDPGYAHQHGQILNSLRGLAPAPLRQAQPSNLWVLINTKSVELQRVLVNEQADFEEYLAECLPDPGQMQNKLNKAVGCLQEMLKKLLRLGSSLQITPYFNRAVSQLNLQVGRLGEPYVWRQVSQQAFRLRAKQLLGKIQVLLQSYTEFGNLATQITATQPQQNGRGITPANIQQNGLGSTLANGQNPNWPQQTQSSAMQPQPQHGQPSTIRPRHQQTQPSAIRHHRHHQRQQRQSPYPPRGLSQPPAQSSLDQQQRDAYFPQNQSDRQRQYLEDLILGYSQEQQEPLNTYPQPGHQQGSPYPPNQPMDIPLNGYQYSPTQPIDLPPNSYHQPPNQAATLPVYSFVQPTNQFVPLSPNSNQHLPNQSTNMPPNGYRSSPNQRASLPLYMMINPATGLNEAFYPHPNGHQHVPNGVMNPPTNGYQPNQFTSLPPYTYQPPPTQQPSLPTPDTPSQQLHPTPSADHPPLVQAPNMQRIRRKVTAETTAIRAPAAHTDREATPAPPEPSPAAVPEQFGASQNQSIVTTRLPTPAPPTIANVAEAAQNGPPEPETKLPAPMGWRPDMHYVHLWGLFMDRKSNKVVKEEMAKQFPGLGQLGKAWVERERERFWVEGDGEGEEGRKDLVRQGVEVGPLDVVVVQLAVRWALNFSGGEVGCAALGVFGNGGAGTGGDGGDEGGV